MEEILTTPFSFIYDRFLSKITDDLYLEYTREETEADAQSLLINALSNFEFPRFPIFDYVVINPLNEDGENEVIAFFKSILTQEEIDILSDLMMIEWLSRQVASIDNTRMKYSGSDFKFTSQANHLDKISKTMLMYESKNKHKQRLYKRRKVDPQTGMIQTNWSGLAGGVINGNRN